MRRASCRRTPSRKASSTTSARRSFAISSRTRGSTSRCLFLLDDLITQSRADTAAYEEFLRKAEALAKRLASKGAHDDVPAALHGRAEATVIYRNLPAILAHRDEGAAMVAEAGPAYETTLVTLALEIDRTMRERAPAGWQGDQAREAQVLNALFPLLERNRAATQALFDLLKHLPGYA